MSATCLLDLYKIPLLDSPIGIPGSPVGLCQKCSSLSCGWHGVRTSRGKFLCILCDLLVQASSAGWKAWLSAGGLSTLPIENGVVPGARGGAPAGASDDEAAIDLARALASLFSTAVGAPSPLIVATLDQWLAERPSYQKSMAALKGSADWAVQEINNMFQVGSQAVVSGPARTSPGGSQSSLGYYDSDSVRSLWARLGQEDRRLMATAVLLILVLDLSPDTLPPPVADIATALSGRLRDFPAKLDAIRRQILAKQ
jgi:hypothetical protein